MEFDDYRNWGNKNYTTSGQGRNFNVEFKEKKNDICLDLDGFSGPIVCEDMKDACTVIESLLRRNLSVTAIPKRSFIEEKIYIFYRSDKRRKE